MEFYLVNGLPHAGKSTWINNNMDLRNPGLKIIDVYHIQSEYCDEDDIEIIYSYLLDECDCTFSYLAGRDVTIIVEAALLTKLDRKLMKDKFEQYRKPGDRSFHVWCSASENDIIDRIRFDQIGTEGEEWVWEAIEHCEEPVDDEGFDELIIARSEGCDRKNIRTFLARYHCGYAGNDPVEAEEIIDDFENGEGSYKYGATLKKKLGR